MDQITCKTSTGFSGYFRGKLSELRKGWGWDRRHAALATSKLKVNPHWVNSTENGAHSYQSCSWREWRDLKNLIHRTPGNIQSNRSLWCGDCIIQGSGLQELILGKAPGCNLKREHPAHQLSHDQRPFSKLLWFFPQKNWKSSILYPKWKNKTIILNHKD